MAALLDYGLTQPRIVRFTSFDFATLRSGRTGGGNPCILSVAPVGAKSKGQDEREREGLLLLFLRTRESGVFFLTNRKAKTLDSRLRMSGMTEGLKTLDSRLKMSGMTEGLKTLDSSPTPDYKRRGQAILNRGSRVFPLTPAPGSSPGQALSRKGRGGKSNNFGFVSDILNKPPTLLAPLIRGKEALLSRPPDKGD